MLKAIQAFDERVSIYLVRHRFSPRLHKGLQWYTRLGDGYVWALVIGYLFWQYPQPEVWMMVKRSFLAAGISLFLYMAIKYSVRRMRPFEKLKNISAEVPPLDAFSFPSGHTMNNLAVGFTLAVLAPEIGWIVVIMPISWGALRVYFGVHWLTDILAGMLLAAASYAIAAAVWMHWFAG